MRFLNSDLRSNLPKPGRPFDDLIRTIRTIRTGSVANGGISSPITMVLSGATAFYFNVPTIYRKLGCTISNEPLGATRSPADKKGMAAARSA